ncbi:MAG: hypothetical protein ACTHQ3_06060 [Motilibacteraceae bacterium]
MTSRELPAGWSTASIQDLVAVDGIFVDGDWVESKDQDPDGPVRLTQLADIGDGVWQNKSNRFMSREKATQLGCTFLVRGDVLVARMPEPLGRACQFPGSDQDCVTVVDVAVIRPGVNSVDARWLTHIINSPAVRHEVAGLASGTTRRRVSRKNLANVVLPVPPLPEQVRIVQELERRLSRIDATDRSLRSSLSKLEAAEGALVEWAVSGQLLDGTCSEEDAQREAGRLVEKVADLSPRAKWRVVNPAKLDPEREGGWPTVALGRLTQDAGYGTSEKTSLTTEGVAVLRIPNIRRRAIDLTELKYLAADKVSTEQRLAEGDVLFIRSNGSPSLIGVAAAVTPAAAGHTFASYLIRFRMGDPLLARWVELVASAPSRRRWLITQSSSSAGQHNLGQPDIAALPIPVPAREDMERVLREFDRRQSLVTAARRTCEQQLARCEQARRAVLTWAFTGRLVEQRPDEEPAQRLLERIAADRAANPTRKRSRTARTSKEKSA